MKHGTLPIGDHAPPAYSEVVNAADAQAVIAEDDDRLIELLERWDELYRRDETATPETLGVGDSSLRAALLQQIEQRRRLYEFMKLSKLPSGPDPARDGTADAAENAGNGNGEDRLGPAQWIGRYLALETLGEGRQGQIFRVVHPTMAKELVLKLAVRGVELDDGWKERLLYEGRLLAACEHPNLVRVIDLDFHEGRPFIVMDHVRGVDLKRYVAQRRPGARAAARLVAELALAVSYINGRGIVHQDIKPANVLVDEHDRPRLVDFGLAHQRDAWSADAPGKTGGTPAYMSPEQAVGEKERIGPCSDVFGLGGVLYFLLTRQPVYSSTPNVLAIQQAKRGDQIAPRRVNARVPRSLERICLKALNPDAEHRYQTAAELERALRRYLRRPKILAVGGALIFSLLALWRFASWSPARTENPASAQASAAGGKIISPPPVSALRIASLEVKHFRGDKPPMALGTIGDSTEPILFDDDVRLHVRFSDAAFCYLVAINPDGKIQLCYPGTPTETPAKTNELSCPPENLYFPLNDGTGLQAFLVLASRAPLPPYAQWKGSRAVRWDSVPSGDSGIWSFNGSVIEPMADGRRGQPRSRDGAPRCFRELCDWVKHLTGIDAARAIAFPVVKRRSSRSLR